MEYHFGHNCQYYLPILNKCRILIDNYRRREDLVELKWLNTRDLLTYLNLPYEELLRQITTDEIKFKQQKNGIIMFQVLCAWQWDDCPLVSNAGRCFYFESHNGEKITYLIELKSLKPEHPNLKNIPSEEDINTFERKAIEATGRHGNDR